jgi:hypothetical protein
MHRYAYAVVTFTISLKKYDYNRGNEMLFEGMNGFAWLQLLYFEYSYKQFSLPQYYIGHYDI